MSKQNETLATATCFQRIFVQLTGFEAGNEPLPDIALMHAGKEVRAWGPRVEISNDAYASNRWGPDGKTPPVGLY